MQRRYEISDERGNRIEHMFPKTKTRRPGKDLRRSNCLQQCALEGPSERFGSWKTVYSRFRKWRDEGTLFKVFEHLKEDADYENLSFDSTTVSAHQSSAGAKKGRKIQK